MIPNFDGAASDGDGAAMSVRRTARRERRASVGLAIGLCAGLFGTASIADSQSAYIFDHLSESKAPVDFRVHGTYYRVPRNYITEMQNFHGGDQALVVMRVTFPGFQPFSAQTRQCLDSAPAFRPPGCLQVEFNLGPPEGTNAEGYKNFFNLVDRINPHGPYGYEVWSWGKDNYFQSIFHKPGSSEGELAFFCIGDPEKLDNPLTGCHGLTKEKSGNAIFFSFPITQLSVAEQIQRGLVALVNGFNVGGENRP